MMTLSHHSFLYRKRTHRQVASIMMLPTAFMTLMLLMVGVVDAQPLVLFLGLWAAYQTYLLFDGKRKDLMSKLPLFQLLEDSLRHKRGRSRKSVDVGQRNASQADLAQPESETGLVPVAEKSTAVVMSGSHIEVIRPQKSDVSELDVRHEHDAFEIETATGGKSAPHLGSQLGTSVDEVDEVITPQITAFESQPFPQIKGREELLSDEDAQREAEFVKTWLEDTVGLPDYYEVFVRNKYDSLATIQRIEEKAELQRIGIAIPAHQVKLFAEIKRLRKQSASTTGGV